MNENQQKTMPQYNINGKQWKSVNRIRKKGNEEAEESFVKWDKHCMKWLPYSGSYHPSTRTNTRKNCCKDVENLTMAI